MPTVLLITFMVAFVFMGVACYCTVMIFRIATESFLVVYQKDKSLYRQILDGRESSWIERRTHSIKDFSLWWSIYRTLYRGGRIEEIIGQKTRIQFSRYARVMLASYISAMLLAVIVVSIGFILAR